MNEHCAGHATKLDEDGFYSATGKDRIIYVTACGCASIRPTLCQHDGIALAREHDATCDLCGKLFPKNLTVINGIA